MNSKAKKNRWTVLKKYIAVCSIVGCLIITAVLLSACTLVISNMTTGVTREKEKAEAERMIRDAEEKIGFNEQNTAGGGIFGIPGYLNSHVLVDYDTVEVGMLIDGDVDEFWKVALFQTSKDDTAYQQIVDTYLMQADIPLSSPGKRLVTFSDKDEPHRTTALLLFYEDGTVYRSDRLEEKNGHGRYTGLHWSKYFVGKDKKFQEN